MFSTGFSSGAREGRKIGVMFSGTTSLLVVCQPARSSSRTACAPSGGPSTNSNARIRLIAQAVGRGAVTASLISSVQGKLAGFTAG